MLLGGETVRALQEQSGARVKIDPTNDPNSEERIVNISGDPKCVAIAKQLVEDKVAEVCKRKYVKLNMKLIMLQATRSSGGRYKGYNTNDSYSRGGYKSQEYGQQSGYQGGNEGGYDYSQQQQYNQYYAQYGYDQSQFGQPGQDASNGEGQSFYYINNI